MARSTPIGTPITSKRPVIDNAQTPKLSKLSLPPQGKEMEPIFKSNNIDSSYHKIRKIKIFNPVTISLPITLLVFSLQE